MGVQTRTAALWVGAAIVLALASTVTSAQRATPADVAAKFTGTWKINFELSPRFAPRGGGGGGARTGGPGQPLMARSMSGSLGQSRPAAFQRGGGGGGGAQANPEEMAGNAAIRSLQQVPDSVTIKATADSVTFVDARGERTYAVDNKNNKITVNGATLTTKSRWDRNTLKQEFVFGESRVSHDWELNNEGTRINFKMLVTSMSNLGPGTEAKAVFDKQP